MQEITEQHRALCCAFEKVLYPWRRLVIVVDGRDHGGKTTIASFIAWQYSIPVLYLDLFLQEGHRPIQHDTEALKRFIAVRTELERPVILEGIKVLETLERLELEADFLVYAENTTCEGSIGDEVTEYLSRYRPVERANFVFRWAEHD